MRTKNLLKAIIASIAVILGFVPDCDGAVRTEHNLDDLLRAIATVESNNDPNAFNAKEDAAGLYQIRPIYLADVNRLLGYPRYKLADRYDPVLAKEMVVIYLRHYGKNKSIEAMARIHNGGPRGYKKTSTLRYWQKIKRTMENENKI